MSGSNQDFSPKDWIGQSAIVDLGPTIEGVEVWGEETNQAFRKTLFDWYDKEGRHLPWRESKDPYRIWISEIMLQQTQVNTVIPYYQRFLQAFPTVEDLAAAEEDDLLKLWAGLGYYSRAKNLHRAAQEIVNDYSGQFPQTAKELKQLSGIGPYTAGAIASIAFGQAVPAIDGNAMRVFSRLFTINADISRQKNHAIFREVVAYVMGDERPGDFNQALMDLGSSYETAKKPLSDISPIKDFNLATLTGTELDYPVKLSKTKSKTIHYQALLLENSQGQYLIEKRPSQGLLANLWTVPLFEVANQEEGDQQGGEERQPYQNLVAEAEAVYDLRPVVMKKSIGHVRHVFSHRLWEIDLYYAKLSPAAEKRWQDQEDSDWVFLHDLNRHAYPTVQMKIWQALKDYLDQ
ncbi:MULTISPECIES: A/G-specific adenine glycosylase [Aerococcus]|uniref:Adenine DNA glycosylase n=2 Tax=Aerococcus TaxID=1375 RepID=A0A329NHY2_9LACT|nr:MULTISPECIES: A/G-specific adenine glycosylase [Aerococcus]KAA9218484.1 A/G-specific adenine glycosylase [Aerococcus loyolae]KAA9264947.1 A/G-specific adenine glycosylase [Aerococcus loyolae]MCY3025998.1 A/G-specific adenine glycosylase [Aerococcus loyolae]MCY3028087.1 A/G-specific adenine glycosylase [Aerococcus loyolae]MCY3029745.1 A/G-specific adenine glycosylase [Aerococcus loyolae]